MHNVHKGKPEKPRNRKAFLVFNGICHDIELSSIQEINYFIVDYFYFAPIKTIPFLSSVVVAVNEIPVLAAFTVAMPEKVLLLP